MYVCTSPFSLNTPGPGASLIGPVLPGQLVQGHSMVISADEAGGRIREGERPTFVDGVRQSYDLRIDASSHDDGTTRIRNVRLCSK